MRVGHDHFEFMGEFTGKTETSRPTAIGECGFCQNNGVFFQLKLGACLLQRFHVPDGHGKPVQHLREASGVLLAPGNKKYS
jgi:hypothetical protein